MRSQSKTMPVLERDREGLCMAMLESSTYRQSVPIPIPRNKLLTNTGLGPTRIGSLWLHPPQVREARVASIGGR